MRRLRHATVSKSESVSRWPRLGRTKIFAAPGHSRATLRNQRITTRIGVGSTHADPHFRLVSAAPPGYAPGHGDPRPDGNFVLGCYDTRTAAKKLAAISVPPGEP